MAMSDQVESCLQSPVVAEAEVPLPHVAYRRPAVNKHSGGRTRLVWCSPAAAMMLEDEVLGHAAPLLREESKAAARVPRHPANRLAQAKHLRRPRLLWHVSRASRSGLVLPELHALCLSPPEPMQRLRQQPVSPLECDLNFQALN